MPSVKTSAILAILTVPLLANPSFRGKRQSVRAQLASLQQETGLALTVLYHGTLENVAFAKRSIEFEGKLPFPAGKAQDGIPSPDGSELAFAFDRSSVLDATLGIVSRDGTHFREYSEILRPAGFCWSSDSAIIAVSSQIPNSQTRPPQRMLLILNLAANATRKVDLGGEVTPQCWSPDRQKIVYASGSGYNASIRIYDLVQDKWKEVAHGYEPTWSPDGEWIAFRSSNSYYAVRPSGLDRRLLFKVKNPYMGLLWSPNSRIVAYQAFTTNRQPLDPSLLTRIYVRRLDDNSQDWVAVVNMGTYFVWTQSQKNGKN